MSRTGPGDGRRGGHRREVGGVDILVCCAGVNVPVRSLQSVDSG